jgi:hypothetical protein
VADGQCQTSCAVDPDCKAPCAADGQCGAGCGMSDPDCNVDVNPCAGGNCIDIEDDDGCSFAAPPRSAGALGYLAALGLIFAARRRRR